jgi:ATP-dependent exoDNAse (exonuclease V) beta subunit
VAHAYLEKHVFGSDLDHKLLESVFSGLLGQQKETVLLASPVLERMKTRVNELLLQAITDRSLLELLEGVRQYSEIPFVLNRKQGYTFRGRIDKLFQDRGTDEWALLDWKTGSIEQRDPIAFAEEHYFDLQLACYRFVVQELKYGRVGRMYLYFVSPGKLVEIEYEGNPGREIDEIIGFLERYKADEDEIGTSVKQAKRKAGECVQCRYFQMRVCL